jgi:hypothetical protein
VSGQSAEGLGRLDGSDDDPAPQEPEPLRPSRPARNDAAPGPGRISRELRRLRRHWMFAAVLVVAAVLRTMVYLAYRPALMYPDSRTYLAVAAAGRPAADRPYGYSAFLNLLSLAGSVPAVTVLQHLMGLALVVAGYALLVRHGVRRWIAVLATVPVALDARHIVLEHFVLAETLFTFLLAAAMLLLVRPGRIGAARAAAVGVFLAAACLTRTVGLPVVGLIVLYLLVRRVQLRSIAAFVVAAALSVGAYAAWYHHNYGVYALGQFDGRFLYARTTTFVDCAKLTLPDSYRPLCPEVPVSQRSQRTDEYVWTNVSPAHRKYSSLKYDPFLRKFAVTAIRQQPLDYATVVLRETGWHFIPGLVRFDAGQRCLARAWQLPVSPTDTCQTYLYTINADGRAKPSPQATALRPVLRAYSRDGRVPGPVLLLGIALAVAGAAWRPRRPGWADGRDGLLFGATGLGLVVLSVATSMYDPRYMMPALFFIGIGAALGTHRLMAPRRPGTEPAAPPPEQPAPATDQAS